MKKVKTDIIGVLSLFTSFSTLICCALPMVLVGLGFGAVVAGLVASYPILSALSEYKDWAFLLATALIVLNFWMLYKKSPEDINCEIPTKGENKACKTASSWSKTIVWISAGLLFIGIITAYFALPIMQYLEN